jgi:outer membrane biosynthesis protein TonB
MMTVDQLLERLEASERAATGPPAETGERVWSAIEDRLANGPAPPEIDDGPLLEHGPSEVVAGAGSSSSVALKIVGVLAAVGVIGGGVALLSKREPPPREVAVVEPASIEPESPEPALPEPALPEPASPEPEPASIEPAPIEPAPIEPAPVEPPPDESIVKPKTQQKPPAQPKSLTDEVALMQALSTALKQEDSSKVLALVAEHERDFPKGQFIEERRAAKARALCRSGKLAAGKREAEAFASRWPDSIHMSFVNEDCGLE